MCGAGTVPGSSRRAVVRAAAEPRRRPEEPGGDRGHVIGYGPRRAGRVVQQRWATKSSTCRRPRQPARRSPRRTNQGHRPRSAPDARRENQTPGCKPEDAVGKPGRRSRYASAPAPRSRAIATLSPPERRGPEAPRRPGRTGGCVVPPSLGPAAYSQMPGAGRRSHIRNEEGRRNWRTTARHR